MRWSAIRLTHKVLKLFVVTWPNLTRGMLAGSSLTTSQRFGEVGCLFRPDPLIVDLAWRRRSMSSPTPTTNTLDSTALPPKTLHISLQTVESRGLHVNRKTLQSNQLTPVPQQDRASAC